MTRVINPKKKFNPTHRSAGLNKGVELENIHWHQEKPVDSGGQPIDLTQYEILDCSGKKALNVIDGCIQKTNISWIPICINNQIQYMSTLLLWDKISNVEVYKNLFLINGIITEPQSSDVILYQECSKNIFLEEEVCGVINNDVEKYELKRRIDKLFISINSSNKWKLGNLITECPYIKGKYIIDTKYDKEIGLLLENDEEYSISSREL